MRWMHGAAAAVALLALVHDRSRGADDGPAPPSKVGVVNLGAVFGKYEKASHFKAEMEASLMPVKNNLESLNQQLVGLKKQLEVPMADAAVALVQAQIAAKTKEIEAVQADARKQVGKRSEAQLSLLWKEINAAIEQRARAQAFTLVLAFGDPTAEEAEKLGPFANINRKLQAVENGGVNPIFIHPSIDITEAVVQQLNEAYRKTERQGPRGPLSQR